MDKRTGVRVSSVAPLGAAKGKVNVGDILLSVDGHAPGAATWSRARFLTIRRSSRSREEMFSLSLGFRIRNAHASW